MTDHAASLASKNPSERAAAGEVSGIESRAAWHSGWSAVPLDEEASRRLTQQRIGFFGGVFLLLSVAFYLRNAVAIGVLAGSWPPLGHPAFLFHLAAIALHAAEWSWCRFGRLSRRQLDAIDAPPWTPEHGERWWHERGPGVIAAVNEKRNGNCTPGPRTIAVDLQRRTPGSALPGTAA